jgi:hypothetical protein
MFVVSSVTAFPKGSSHTEELTKHSPNGNAEWLWNRYATAIGGEDIAACIDGIEEMTS